MKRFGLTLVAIAVIVGINIFTVNSRDVGKYNDKVIDELDAMNMQFETYWETAGVYYEGVAVDMNAVRSEHQVLHQRTKEAVAMLEGLKVPDEETVNAFHKTALEYARNAEELCVKYVEMMDYMQKHNPPDEAEIDTADAIIFELVAKDQDLMTMLQTKQEIMADKHDMTLK